VSFLQAGLPGPDGEKMLNCTSKNAKYPNSKNSKKVESRQRQSHLNYLDVWWQKYNVAVEPNLDLLQINKQKLLIAKCAMFSYMNFC